MLITEDQMKEYLQLKKDKEESDREQRILDDFNYNERAKKRERELEFIRNISPDVKMGEW